MSYGHNHLKLKLLLVHSYFLWSPLRPLLLRGGGGYSVDVIVIFLLHILDINIIINYNLFGKGRLTILTLLEPLMLGFLFEKQDIHFEIKVKTVVQVH